MERLETERILLRQFQSSDFDGLFAMMSDPEVMRHTGFQKPQSKEKVQEFLDKWMNPQNLPFGVWAAESKDSKELIGWFMLQKTGLEYPEIGFMLPQKHWGKGFATEVSQRILKYAVEELCLDHILAVTVENNESSIRVLKKLGMKNLGPIDPQSSSPWLKFKF